jgi:hypothetical protein
MQRRIVKIVQQEIPTIKESDTKHPGPKYITYQPEGEIWQNFKVAKLKYPAEKSKITNKIIRNISADQMAEYCFRTEDLSNRYLLNTIFPNWCSEDDAFNFRKFKFEVKGGSISGTLIQNRHNMEMKVFISDKSIANSYKFLNGQLQEQDIINECQELNEVGLFANDDPSQYMQNKNAQNYAKKPIEEEKKQEKAANQDEAVRLKLLEVLDIDITDKDTPTCLKKILQDEGLLKSIVDFELKKQFSEITYDKTYKIIEGILSEDEATRKFFTDYFFEMEEEKKIEALEQKDALETISEAARKCGHSITPQKLSSSLKMVLSESKQKLKLIEKLVDFISKKALNKITGKLTPYVIEKFEMEQKFLDEFNLNNYSATATIENFKEALELVKIKADGSPDAKKHGMLAKLLDEFNLNNYSATIESFKEVKEVSESVKIEANENNHMFNQADNLD